ncbi:hypothetical protein GII30_19520 [Gordonia amarae]|nr:hypothetical protein [Gordonia amarae]MCS3880628.1 hypothetical protein [Gordonia amarae]QHN18935.1 hypothetical protein GII35_19875 [Gordonia amarae]QHN23410.1 hypothetical protein GII34_19375 [Gordonia amarae]QHN32311.1 hypothetical protein GII32_19690 [Gordonia amarae]QHN41059.1 hypothetical protein GII30_19520 [Gordonia amarae]
MNEEIDMPPGPDHPEDITGYGVGKRHLMAMHLDQPIGTLTPAQVAFALGNDPDLIMDSIDHEEEQSGMAAADAAHARRSGDEYAAERDLAESRSWANSAQTKREALNWLTAQAGTPFVEFAFDNEMRAVRLAAWAVADAYQACFADECDENPADCPTHGGLVAARKLAEESETDRLRSRFLDAFHASAAKRTA